MFTLGVSTATLRRGLIRGVRLYPILAVGVLVLAHFLGAFSKSENPLISRSLVLNSLYAFVGLVPLLFITGFVFVGARSDHAMVQSQRNRKKLITSDPFLLPSEAMVGYKLALITNRPPMLTGLTGETYYADDHARCDIKEEHIPPIADCDCGFYAYREYRDAKFELTLNPGAFLIDVELYGMGFVYTKGYRAEVQQVNKLSLPRRCMNCHLLPAHTFVAKYKLGYYANTFWQWKFCCTLCSSVTKNENKMTVEDMKNALSVPLHH